MISVKPASVWHGKKLYPCNFLGHYKCQTLQQALPIHTTFSDNEYISRSQQSETVLTVNFTLSN